MASPTQGNMQEVLTIIHSLKIYVSLSKLFILELNPINHINDYTEQY